MRTESGAVAATASFLEAEIAQQGAVLRRVLDRRTETVAETMRSAAELDPSGWVVTGCGDSLFAGQCAEYWFAAGGVPLRAQHALAFSRYLYRAVDERSVVFAISYSGTTRRVVEAAVAARSRGASVVAVTTNESSPLVELADWWLPNDATEERSNCRTTSFAATCALLQLSASAVAGVAAPTERIADAVGALARSAAAPVRELVAGLPDDPDVTVVGGGWAHPLAHYGAAKLYEAATIPAHAAEVEQFVHCEIFPVTPASIVVLVAPSGPSYARAAEVADGLSTLGAHTIGISDDGAFAKRCRAFLPLPSGLGESAVPYLAAAPLQLFALEWAKRLGDDPDVVANKPVNRPLIESPLAWGAADYEAAR